ncbi:MAG: imidazolonepropionase [Acidobacteriota bacterium]
MQDLSHCDLLLRHARLATMAGPRPYGLIDDGALAVRGGQILWVGGDDERPPELVAANERDCGSRLVTPGLIDCHTHLVWGGDRLDEFEQRLSGVPYAEIARRGGGINSTVEATRRASFDELLAGARGRLEGLLREGVTRVEIKSGYGLEMDTEKRMLEVARRLGEELPVSVHTSFLGAHAVPPELAGDGDAYLERVIAETLPAVAAAGLADAVDGFLEHIAFSPEQIERLFRAAADLGLPVKLHAEQLSNQGGAALAARFGALSADHLEYLDEAGVASMAAAGTVAVLLPGAFFFLRESQRPPVAELRRRGVAIALATDLNPGSSPLHSLLAAASLGTVLFHLTPEEALAGITRHAAAALGVAHQAGTLEVGKSADLALWDCSKPAALVANLGANPCVGRYLAGEWHPGRERPA